MSAVGRIVQNAGGLNAGGLSAGLQNAGGLNAGGQSAASGDPHVGDPVPGAPSVDNRAVDPRGPARPRGLPGIAVGGTPAGALPRLLLDTGSLLLSGVSPGARMDLAAHRARWGVQPSHTAQTLSSTARWAQVVGGGGAGFPFWRKVESVAGRRVWAVVVNAAEGEVASGKDAVLLTHVPHLVLDGATAAAAAVGCARVIVRVPAARDDVIAHVSAAIAERPESIEVSIGPDEFVAGEASAVISGLIGGPPVPVDLGRPPRVRTGLVRRKSAVLLSNVETFARLAVATRGVQPRSALLSMSGAVERPGVVELPEDATIATALRLAGGLHAEPDFLITGGWHGRWLRWDRCLADTGLTRDAVDGIGGRWGAGAFIWVPQDLHPAAVLAGIMSELARSSAGQCGPCIRGMPELAGLLHHSAALSTLPDANALAALVKQIQGRGMCAHPTAAVAALRSALDAIGGGDSGSAEAFRPRASRSRSGDEREAATGTAGAALGRDEVQAGTGRAPTGSARVASGRDEVALGNGAAPRATAGAPRGLVVRG